MADVFTPEKRSEVMSRILSKGNKGTELRLMLLMQAAEIRGWRRQVTVRVKDPKRKGRLRLKVKPDFVFWKARVAVFVDGCFWHGCPRHGTQPKQNGAFWEAKILRNQKRDRKVARELRKAGWSVLRIWECALTARRAEATVARVKRAVEM